VPVKWEKASWWRRIRVKKSLLGVKLYGGFAGLKELDGVRTPVHLSLQAGLRLEADDGRFFRARPEMPKPIPENADAPVVAGGA